MLLYYRFNLCQRDIKDLLAERGIVVSYESIRLRCNKFGPAYSRRLKRRHQGFGDTFYLDKVFVKTRGKQHYFRSHQQRSVLSILDLWSPDWRALVRMLTDEDIHEYRLPRRDFQRIPPETSTHCRSVGSKIDLNRVLPIEGIVKDVPILSAASSRALIASALGYQAPYHWNRGCDFPGNHSNRQVLRGVPRYAGCWPGFLIFRRKFLQSTTLGNNVNFAVGLGTLRARHI